MLVEIGASDGPEFILDFEVTGGDAVLVSIARMIPATRKTPRGCGTYVPVDAVAFLTVMGEEAMRDLERRALDEAASVLEDEAEMARARSRGREGCL